MQVYTTYSQSIYWYYSLYPMNSIGVDSYIRYTSLSLSQKKKKGGGEGGETYYLFFYLSVKQIVRIISKIEAQITSEGRCVLACDDAIGKIDWLNL